MADKTVITSLFTKIFEFVFVVKIMNVLLNIIVNLGAKKKHKTKIDVSIQPIRHYTDYKRPKSI